MMINFRQVLALLIDEHEIKPAHICRDAKVENSVVNRVLHGKQDAISRKNAEKIILYFKSSRDRMLLTKAFAEDHLIGPCKDKLHVSPK